MHWGGVMSQHTGRGVIGGLCRVLACAGAALGLSAAAYAECKLILLSDMPVMMRGDKPMLEVGVNGRPVNLLVDTGAFWSVLGVAKADELGLRVKSAPNGMRIRGIGGSTSAQMTRVDHFKFAEWDLENVEFFVIPLPVGEGVLGQNILSLAEVEYDLSNGRVRLFHGDDCDKSALAYWAGERSFSVVDLRDFDSARNMITAYAHVNGERMRVLVDTGASSTVLSARAARRAGIDVEGPEAEAGRAIGGIGRRTRQTWKVRLDTFEMGGQEVSNPPVRVVDANLSVDMILGVDFLSAHRIFVSNKQKKMYFTYEGGPIFNSEADAYLENEDGELVDHDAVAADDPTDAEGFALRGAARLSQDLVAEALADFDEAIRLDPGQASYFLQRARARLSLLQMDEAYADVEASIGLDAGNAEALIMRASMKAGRGDGPDAALEDAMAASAAIPEQSNLRLQLGALFSGLDRYDQAIVEYTHWIDAHRQDVRRPIAMNGRCWARAMLNVDLDDALDDCNEAVRWASGNPAFLDSRGLVRLRRGQFDRAIDDYDKALEIAPEMAWSLYGRSLAHRAEGEDAKAEADLAAAISADEGIVEEAGRFGL